MVGSLSFLHFVGQLASGSACELAQQLCDGLIAILGHVLVAQCGLWCAVAQPSHQLGQAGSGGSRQHRTGVPQVVEAKVRTTGDRAGRRRSDVVSSVLGRQGHSENVAITGLGSRPSVHGASHRGRRESARRLYSEFPPLVCAALQPTIRYRSEAMSFREERLKERVEEIRPQLSKAREIAEKAESEGREVADAVKQHRHDQ